MITDGAYQSLALISDQGVILVDAPPTLGVRLQYAIRNITSLPITTLIYSHAHADHIGAAYLLTSSSSSNSSSTPSSSSNSSLQIIAHQETADLLTSLSDPTRPPPTTTFTSNHTLILGNQTLSLTYHGANHLPGNIFIHHPALRILMVVDIVFPGWVPFAGLVEPASLPGYLAAPSQILDGYDFEIFVGGHLTRSGTRQDVQMHKEYMDDLVSSCTRAIGDTNATMTVMGQVGQQNPGNPWAVFKEVVADQARLCANEVGGRWMGRLGGVDVWGYENAFRIVEGLRVDYGVLGMFEAFTG